VEYHLLGYFAKFSFVILCFCKNWHFPFCQVHFTEKAKSRSTLPLCQVHMDFILQTRSIQSISFYWLFCLTSNCMQLDVCTSECMVSLAECLRTGTGPGLGSGKWFCSCMFSQFADAGKKLQQIHVPIREECNKYDLTVTTCFWLVNHNDWSRWFAISRLSPICSLVSLL